MHGTTDEGIVHTQNNLRGAPKTRKTDTFMQTTCLKEYLISCAQQVNSYFQFTFDIHSINIIIIITDPFLNILESNNIVILEYPNCDVIIFFVLSYFIISHYFESVCSHFAKVILYYFFGLDSFE